MKNENTWTQGGERHTLGSVGGDTGDGQQGYRELERDNMGINARYS